MKTIARVWMFASSSGRAKYQTLQYGDATTSCNCPGWTRRCAHSIDAHQNVVEIRSCKHTRLVDMRRADSECLDSHDYVAHPANQPYQESSQSRNAPASRPEARATQTKPAIGFRERKLCL